LQPTTTARRRSKERTTGKLVIHNTENSRRKLRVVGVLQITWGILYLAIPTNKPSISSTNQYPNRIEAITLEVQKTSQSNTRISDVY
jgi:hypothetical protein